MKKIMKILSLSIVLWMNAQSGGDIAGLVKVENIRDGGKNNRILVTDGNGNLAFRTYRFIYGLGGGVYSPSSNGETRYTHMPVFKNLPDKESSRYVIFRLATNNIAYMTGTSSNVNYPAPAEGDIGLKVLGDLFIPTNNAEPPASFKYAVVVDNNGVLGKREIIVNRTAYSRRYSLVPLDGYNADCFTTSFNGFGKVADFYDRWDYGFGVDNHDRFYTDVYIREAGGTTTYGVRPIEIVHTSRYATTVGDIVIWTSGLIPGAPSLSTTSVGIQLIGNILNNSTPRSSTFPGKRCAFRKVYD